MGRSREGDPSGERKPSPASGAPLSGAEAMERIRKRFPQKQQPPAEVTNDLAQWPSDSPSGQREREHH